MTTVREPVNPRTRIRSGAMQNPFVYGEVVPSDAFAERDA
jgi:hypothetical protein